MLRFHVTQTHKVYETYVLAGGPPQNIGYNGQHLLHATALSLMLKCRRVRPFPQSMTSHSRGLLSLRHLVAPLCSSEKTFQSWPWLVVFINYSECSVCYFAKTVWTSQDFLFFTRISGSVLVSSQVTGWEQVGSKSLLTAVHCHWWDSPLMLTCLTLPVA